jgi:hypothetical protein
MSKSDWKKHLTAEELAEYERLIATPEVKAAQKVIRERNKAKRNLYNARALYKQGKEDTNAILRCV